MGDRADGDGEADGDRVERVRQGPAGVTDGTDPSHGAVASSLAGARAQFRFPRRAIVYTGYAIMETEKIGMREFRENLAGYLEAGKPLAITRHGETLGYYIPARKKSKNAEVAAMRAAAKDLDAMIAGWGVSEEELMEEYKEIRRSRREKKRDAK